jgi:hypothetical protein
METEPKLRLIRNRQPIPMVRIVKRTVFRFVIQFILISERKTVYGLVLILDEIFLKSFKTQSGQVGDHSK